MARKYYVWYKHKVAGPFGEEHDLNKVIEIWMEMVDAYKLTGLPDTPPMTKDMEDYPNKPHVIMSEDQLNNEPSSNP